MDINKTTGTVNGLYATANFNPETGVWNISVCVADPFGDGTDVWFSMMQWTKENNDVREKLHE